MNDDNDYTKMEQAMSKMHEAFVEGRGNTLVWADDPATVMVYAYNNGPLGCIAYGLNANFGGAKLHREGFLTPYDASVYALNWVVEQSSIFTDKVCVLYGAVLAKEVKA